MKDVCVDDETYMEYDSGMSTYILLILKGIAEWKMYPLIYNHYVYSRIFC